MCVRVCEGVCLTRASHFQWPPVDSVITTGVRSELAGSARPSRLIFGGGR